MKTFFIKTYGCQMNELDSEMLAGILEKNNLTQVDSEESADLIIYNTCSVRDLAERKIMGKIGLLSRIKKKKIIGIAGCMAMIKKEKLLKKFPYINFILGPNNISDIENILKKVIEEKKILKTDEHKNFLDYTITKRKNKIKAYISIIKGCNNFCSYCIVPYTRGREVSKDPKKIIEECKYLQEQGYKEIILLGQNVNSYGKEFNIHFSDLLYKLGKINQIKRIRFLTSHPKDLKEDLMYAMRDIPSVCEYLHLPLQSGSNKILKMMNRGYTKEDYLKKIEKLKKIIPNIKFGTDIIIGFPNETIKDFEETYNLFKQINFSNSYIFKYSPRKNTYAYKLKDEISQEEKKIRMDKLFDLQKKILEEEAKKEIGKSYEILIERLNKDNRFLKGRTRCNKKVIIEGKKDLIGSFKNVILKKFTHQTFTGKLI